MKDKSVEVQFKFMWLKRFYQAYLYLCNTAKEKGNVSLAVEASEIYAELQKDIIKESRRAKIKIVPKRMAVDRKWVSERMQMVSQDSMYLIPILAEVDVHIKYPDDEYGGPEIIENDTE